MIATRRNGGFSLVELAVVLLVVALLLTGLLLPLATQMEVSRVEETKRQLAQIREALYGFAMTHGRLPCPALSVSGGRESPTFDVPGGDRTENDLVGGGAQDPLDPDVVRGWCTRGGVGADNDYFTADDDYDFNIQHGFVPAVTLGITGPFNEDQLLVDAWGNPFRYSVSARDENGARGSPADNNVAWDFVTAGELQREGRAVFGPHPDLLVVCDNAPNETSGAGATGDTACAGGTVSPPSRTLTDVAPAVFLSLGPDGPSASETRSMHQVENAGERLSPSLQRIPPIYDYLIATDLVFVSRERRGRVDAGDYFDDLVAWISPTVLYARLVEAGQLP